MSEGTQFSVPEESRVEQVALSPQEVEDIIRLHFEPDSATTGQVNTRDVAEALGIPESRVAELLSKSRAQSAKVEPAPEQLAMEAMEVRAKANFRRYWPLILAPLVASSLLMFLLTQRPSAQEMPAPVTVADVATFPVAEMPPASAAPFAEARATGSLRFSIKTNSEESFPAIPAANYFNQDLVLNGGQAGIEQLVEQAEALLAPGTRVSTTAEGDALTLEALRSGKSGTLTLAWTELRIVQEIPGTPLPLVVAKTTVPLYSGNDLQTEKLVRAEQKKRVEELIKQAGKVLKG